MLKIVALAALAASLATGLVVPIANSFSSPPTYYVATTGQDAGDCTSSPCASFLYATQQAQGHPGATVLVASGTYGPQRVTITGTADAPVTIQAQGPVTLTRPLPLTQQGQATALLRVVNSSYVTLRGFTVVGAKNQPGFAPTVQPYGGEVEAENHTADPGAGIVFDSLTVTDANNTGIKLQDHEPGAAIVNCAVTDAGSPIPASGKLDQGIYTSGPDTLIANNAVGGGSGYGIQAWPTGGGYVGGATISGNTVYSNTVGGIVAGESPITVTGNTLYGNGGAAITLSDYYYHPPVGTPASVASYNVFYRNGRISDYSTASILLGDDDPSGVLIDHNTAYRDAGAFVGSQGGLGSYFARPFTLTDNIVSVDPTAYDVPRRGIFNDPPAAGSVLANNDIVDATASVATSGGADYEPDALAADPLFVDAAASAPDLHLRAGSVAASMGAFPLDQVPPTQTQTPTGTPTAVSTGTPTDEPTPTRGDAATATATATEPSPTATATQGGAMPALMPGQYTVETTIRTVNGTVVAHYWSQFIQPAPHTP